MSAVLHRKETPIFMALAAMLALVPATVQAQEPQIERIDYLDVGIYCAATITKTPEPNSPGGYVNVISEPDFIVQTNRVPLQLGIRFGVRYIVVGNPTGTSVDLRYVTKMPSPGMRNPATGKTMPVSDYMIVNKIGASSYRGVQFEYDWELLPGIWTFEFWYKDRRLAAQAFTLTRSPSAQRRIWSGRSCSPQVSSLTAPMIARRN